MEGQEPQLSGEEVSPSQRAVTRRLVRPVRVIGNRLDSSVLVHKRGKERTKKKKPSLLKRVILQERAERRRRAGLESAAAALFAGLSVKEPVVVLGGQAASVKEDTGEDVRTAPEVKQDAETQKLDSDVKQERAAVTEQSVSSGVDQLPSPQKQYVILKREPSTPSSQVSASEIKQSTPAQEPVQKVVPKIKQEVISPTSSQNVSHEAKPAASPAVGSTQVTSVSVKQESESAASTVYDTLKAKPSEGPVPNSAASQYASQNDKKPDIPPASTAPDTDPKSTTEGDDDDEPPCRGPDYTPCVTVDPKLLIHSRKFREYCQQTLSSDIDDSARLLLQV